MAVSTLSAMIAALAAHFRAALPDRLASAGAVPVSSLLGAAIREEWPPSEKAIRYTTLSITSPQAGERVTHPPIVVERTIPSDPSEPRMPTLYSVASLVAQLQLDVFARSPEDRRSAMDAISIALSAGIALGEGTLRVASQDYYGREIGFLVDSGWQLDDTASRAGADEWRAVLTVTAEAEEIVPSDEVRLIDLSLDMRTATAAPASVQAVESPSEILIIFRP